MIDTHTHLDYLEQADVAVSEQSPTGSPLTALVCIGASVEHAQNALRLAEQHATVWATVGLHPTDADQDSPSTREQLEALAQHARVVGIGESGLDDYWDSSQRAVQQAAFEWQCDLASRLGKVLVIHTRDKQGSQSAHLGVMEVLRQWPDVPVIFHCFSGNEQLQRFGLDRSAPSFFGFAGNVTYPKASEIHKAARELPLECLLFETDAPFLAPVPKRGKPNRPSYVQHTLAFVAQLRGMSAQQLEQISDQNAIRAYGLPIIPA